MYIIDLDEEYEYVVVDYYDSSLDEEDCSGFREVGVSTCVSESEKKGGGGNSKFESYFYFVLYV